MAAGGLLAPVGLLWLCLAPTALLSLHLRQPQPVLVVVPGQPVEINCEASEDMESGGRVFWYRHGGRDGPDLIMVCRDKTTGRFSCKYEGHKATLSIARARRNDTGLYLCAYDDVDHLAFGSGTALLVGDSWSARSWVRVLAPHGDPQHPPSLVCAMGSTTGPVLVSWLGGAKRMLGGSTELLVSPTGTAGGAGGLCEVHFNASGPPVRRSTELHGATGCSFLTPSLAGVGVLLLLSICLSICWLRCPTPTGHQPETPMPPTPQEVEGELQYAQLRFAAPAGPTP